MIEYLLTERWCEKYIFFTQKYKEIIHRFSYRDRAQLNYPIGTSVCVVVVHIKCERERVILQTFVIISNVLCPNQVSTKCSFNTQNNSLNADETSVVGTLISCNRSIGRPLENTNYFERFFRVKMRKIVNC